MGEPQFGVLMVAVLLVLIVVRIPIAVALIGVSFGGLWYLTNWTAAFGALKVVPYSFMADWTLSSVPMFLLMGYLAFHTGITSGLFNAARLWLVRLPGGLAIASVISASGFAAVTGSSVACAAAMGRIAVPEMLKYKYDAGLATGTVAAAGTIGALIPPSILFIIYGIIANVPIGMLFVGGAVTGIATAISYIVVILLRATFSDGLVPRVDTHFPLSERLAALKEVLPIVVIAVLVFGGMYTGTFTVTEAGAVGTALTVVVAAFRRSLTWDSLKQSAYETVTTTAAIFVIVVGANLFARFISFSQTDLWIAEAINATEANFVLLMIGITILYLILGMFLEPMGAMLLTLPIMLPIMREHDLSLIWFGVVLAKLLVSLSI